MIAKLIALVLPLGLDTFAVAAAIGMIGVSASERRQISVLFTGFEAGMPVVGLALGVPLGHAVGAEAEYVAIGVLIAFGIYTLSSADEDNERLADLTQMRGWRAVALGLSISLDELAIGESLLLAVAAGVLFGVSDVAIKYLTHAHGPVFGLLSPWTLTALISFVVSFYASARSLQIGLAIEVIAITSTAANLSAITGGILVFGEPIGSGAVGIIGRVLAFGLVIAGAALVPAPLRATSDNSSKQIPVS